MITPQWRPDTKQLRQFAGISLFGFAALGVVAWRVHGAVWLAALCAAFGAVVSIVGLVQPDRIRPIYVVLLAISLPVGWMVSGLLLRLVFFGVFAPAGLVLRLFGRDALSLHRPAGRSSHWRDLDAPDDPGSYFRQA